MTNKEIAKAFQELGSIMELHDENPFKIRSYQNAYLTLRKVDRPLAEMSDEEIGAIKGVGAAIGAKIRELIETGKMATLEKYRAKTPEGVRDMLDIPGFGPKKIQVIWKELGVESIGELLYAVNENRLIELKGFGKKTQDDLREKLQYYLRTRDQFHYASLELVALELRDALSAVLNGAQVSLTGAIRRRCNVVDGIELLVATDNPIESLLGNPLLRDARIDNGRLIARSSNGDLPVLLYTCPSEAFGSILFQTTAAPDFLVAFQDQFPNSTDAVFAEEEQVFQQYHLPFIVPELREQHWALDLARENRLPGLLEEGDIRGVLHAHSTYSDGLHTLEEMALYVRDQGYAYLGITDHSKSAFYANGLQPGRVLEQFAEIDRLNAQLAPFRIFKGIESDILNDGSLDYEPDLLAQFDFIIASVHSNLRMDETKATQRLLSAIENPYTSILGHPTGRLLLSRQGYPIDHRRVIDACAANGVAVEINASPYRLDLDWTWIPYALEKGVPIAVNPDAHSREGVHDIHFGVASARKGGLTAGNCLNCLSTEEFTAWCGK